MREVAKNQNNEIIIKTDISENMIYAFIDDRGDVALLCVMDGKLFWKSTDAVCMRWYASYSSVLQAVRQVIELDEYVQCACSPVMEFESTKELIQWAHKKLCLKR